MNVSYGAAPGHLRVEATGAFDLAQARAGLGEVLRQCQERGVFNILVDGRGISTPISIADRYDLATQLASYGSGRIRMAVVVSPANMFSKTFEDTARNRGVHMLTTDSMDAALEFLGLAV